MSTAVVGIILLIGLGISIYTVVSRRKRSGGSSCGCGSSSPSLPNQESKNHKN